MGEETETGCPFKESGNALYDGKGRVVLSVKGKGVVFARYPDMSEREKRYLLDLHDVLSGEAGGEAKDFMGKPQGRQEMEDYFNFRDGGKGDLCG